jgi:hypothetical protein
MQSLTPDNLQSDKNAARPSEVKANISSERIEHDPAASPPYPSANDAPPAAIPTLSQDIGSNETPLRVFSARLTRHQSVGRILGMFGQSRVHVVPRLSA